MSYKRFEFHRDGMKAVPMNEEQGGFQELTGFDSKRFRHNWAPEKVREAKMFLIENIENLINNGGSIDENIDFGGGNAWNFSFGENDFTSKGLNLTVHIYIRKNGEPVVSVTAGGVYGKRNEQAKYNTWFNPTVKVHGIKGGVLQILQVVWGKTNNGGVKREHPNSQLKDDAGNVAADVSYVDNKQLDPETGKIVEALKGQPYYCTSPYMYGFSKTSNDDGTFDMSITGEDDPGGVVDYTEVHFETYFVVTDYNNIKGANRIVGVINWGYMASYARNPMPLPAGIITATNQLSSYANQILSNSGYQSFVSSLWNQ